MILKLRYLLLIFFSFVVFDGLLSKENDHLQNTLLINCDSILADSLYFTKYSNWCEDSLRSNHALSIRIASAIIECFDKNEVKPESWQYQSFAKFYRRLSSYDKSIEYSLKGIEYQKQNKDSVLLSESYYGIGLNYWYKNQSIKALEYLQISYDYAEKLNQSFIIVPVYLMSTCYLNFEDIEKCEELLFKAIDLSKVWNEKKYLQYIYDDLGRVEMQRGNFNKALEYVLKAADYAEAMGDNYKLIHIYAFLGSIYKELNEYEKAKANLVLAYKEVSRRKDLYTHSVICSDIGSLYLAMNKADSAEKYFSEGLQLSKFISENQLIAGSNNDLSNLMIQKGDFEKALHY